MDTSQPRRTAAGRRSALPWPALLWLLGQGSGVLAVGSCCWGPSAVHEGTPCGGGTLSPVSLSTMTPSLEPVCVLPDRRRARLSLPLLLGCSCSLPSAGSSWSLFPCFFSLHPLLVFIFLVPFCCSGWVLWGSRPRFPKPQTRLQALPWGHRLLSQCLRWSSTSSVKPGGHAGAAVS